MTRLLLFVVVAFATTSELRGSIIFSDDFEGESVPPIPPSYIADYDGFANWDVVGSGVDLVGPGGLFPSRIDSLMVDLDGTSGSTLITKTSFDLSPGTYTLMFDLGGPVGGATLDSVVVELGNLFSETITIQEHDPFVTFVRTIHINAQTSARLAFADLGADSNGAFLDDVSLTREVPEPFSFAMWCIGAMSVMGAGAIKRRRVDRQGSLRSSHC